MLTVMACVLGWACQVRAEEAPPLFRVRIEGGAAAAVSSPSSLDLTTGWKRPCVLELENRDAVRREVSFAAAMPVRVALSSARIVLEPRQTRSIPFLLQTLSLDEREVCLTVGSGAQGCSLRIRTNPRPAPSGVRFGALEHFDVEGPIGAASVAPPKPPKPLPSASKKTREGAPPKKELSHLVVAPTGAVAERVLEAMRPIQDLGCQTYRMDVNWRTIEQKPGVFSWDRTDWMVNAIRSPEGGGSRLVAQIGYQPQWLPRDFPKTDEGRQAYSRWTEAVVSRYADRVDTWEIWNEPLLFWLPCPNHKPDKQGPPKKPLSLEETDALAASYADMILSAYQRLIAALTGATACEVKQIPQARIYDSDTSGLVIKAFRRGSEDILCLWNNAPTPRTLRLHASPPSSGEAPIFEHVRFAPAGEFLTERTWSPGDAAVRDVDLTVAPLEFHILSRTSSSHGFDWLAKADVPDPKDLHE
ncbi:MAG: hypothetical protein HY343_07475 [Lentisphaerae bacterium]|nr:hypothetical protein [Lentisphaerota bacterium]